jgi:hypothetical protein
MQFLLFLLSSASTSLIIAYIPHAQAAGFLSIFSASNIVCSLAFTLAFSYTRSARSATFWIPLACAVLLGAIFFVGDPALWFFYPFALLAADYATTQSGSPRLSSIYRILLIVSVLPFVLFEEHFKYWILARSVLCLVFVALALATGGGFVKLNIKTPFRMIAVMYIFYSGSLLALPLIPGVAVHHLKIWYVGSQIGLGLMLKKLDFTMRGANSKIGRIAPLITIATLGLPVGMMLLAPNLLFLAIYVVSALALSQLKVTPVLDSKA